MLPDGHFSITMLAGMAASELKRSKQLTNVIRRKSVSSGHISSQKGIHLIFNLIGFFLFMRKKMLSSPGCFDGRDDSKLGSCLIFVSLTIAACDGGGSAPAITTPPNQATSTQAVVTTRGAEISQIDSSQIVSAVQDTTLNSLSAESSVAVSGVVKSADGAGAAAVFNGPAGITSDGSSLYVSDSGNNTIRKIEIATGLVTTLAGTAANGCIDAIGTAASFNKPFGIATDGGNLYVSDSGNNKIRQINIATGKVTTLAGSGASGSFDGVGTRASFANPNGLTIDKGNLYVADTRNSKIRKIVIATGAVSTLAGSGMSTALDGSAKRASFAQPSGITAVGGSLYVVDKYSQKIRKVEIETGKVTTLAGGGGDVVGRGHGNGKGKAASFTYPSGIAADGNNLYVTDSQSQMIRKIEIATGEVTTFAGTGSIGLLDGPGSSALFNFPEGITVIGNSLYVVDSINNRIRKIAISDQTVTTIAGSGPAWTRPASEYDDESQPEPKPDPCSLGTDGTEGGATQIYPHAITSDGNNLYVTDSQNHKVYKFEISTGKRSTLAGTGAFIDEGEGYDESIKLDGTATEATFHEPAGIIINGKNLYVADTRNNRIRKIVTATGAVSTLALINGEPSGITTDGRNLYITDTKKHQILKVVIATGQETALAGTGKRGDADGVGTAASFNYPEGITTDGTNLYVTDTNNNKIRKIVIASGVVSTIAKSGTEAVLNSKGAKSIFKSFIDIKTDGRNLYVVDTSHHRILKIAIATQEVSTLAGSGIEGFEDGKGELASFFYPQGIAIVGSNLYVSDNYTIRKIVIDTGEVSTVGEVGK